MTHAETKEAIRKVLAEIKEQFGGKVTYKRHSNARKVYYTAKWIAANGKEFTGFGECLIFFGSKPTAYSWDDARLHALIALQRHMTGFYSTNPEHVARAKHPDARQ